MTMKSASTPNKYIGKKAERKNDPKNSAKKTRDFFVLVHLGFFFYKWINEVWSLFLFFFSLSFSYRQNACVQARWFVLYIRQSFLFSCFLVLFYVWRKEQPVLLHKTYNIFFLFLLHIAVPLTYELYALLLSLSLNSNQCNANEKETASCWSPNFLTESKEKKTIKKKKKKKKNFVVNVLRHMVSTYERDGEKGCAVGRG